MGFCTVDSIGTTFVMDDSSGSPPVVAMAYRIKEIREAKGWSQGKLAQKTNLTQGAISLYERGEREPSFDVGLKIAKALGVSPTSLLPGETQESFSHTLEQVALRLPESRRNEAVAILEALATASQAS